MFNSLFNSLFGKNKDNSCDSLDEEKNLRDSDQAKDFDALSGNVTAFLLDEDKDWLFVEKEDENNCISIEQGPNNLQLVPFKNILTHLGSINENDENNFLSANLQALHSSMSDSWFLTPPECFSSVSTIQLESSPLENLLIEHPSMSVYYNFRRGPLNTLQGGEIDDLVVIELSQNENDCDLDKALTKNRDKKNNKKSRASGTQKQSVALVLLKKSSNGPNPKQDQRKPSLGKSAFERNNKSYGLRHARTKNVVINQPMRMMISNKKN